MGFDALLAATDRAVRTTLGSACVYTHAGFPPVTVSGVFDAQYKTEGEPGVATYGPAVFLTLADLPTPPSTGEYSDITVVINGVTYTPHSVEVDVTFTTAVFRLHRV